MAASGSRGRGQGSAGTGADALETLANPNLAQLPAAELVAHLHRDDRRGSDFADVALVLAVRECRLSEAEDRVRELEAELRAAKDAEALARRNSNSRGSDSGGIGGGEPVLAHEDGHRSLAGEPQIGAVTGGEIIRARDVTASDTIVVPDLSAGEIEDGEITPQVCFGAGVNATPAEVGDNMPDELAEESAAERVVLDVAVRSSHKVAQASGGVDSRDEVSEAVASKRKQEPAAASASEYKEQQPLKKKPKPAVALDVAPKLNPTLVAMRAADLVGHLNCYRRTADFVDAAFVLAARERRLDEAEDRVREGSKLMDSLRDKIRERDHSAQEAEAQIRRTAAETEAGLRAKIDRAAEKEAALLAKIDRAAETEAALQAKIDRAAETEVALRDKISKLQLCAAALISSTISERDLTQQAAGHGREPVPQGFITASDGSVAHVAFNDATATGVQTLFAEGEVRGDVPTKMRHGTLWSRPAPHLVGAPLPYTMMIDDAKRATEQEVLSSNAVGQGDRQLSQDILTSRVTTGRHTVSEEEAAQGEDVTASRHGHLQEQQVAKATKKVCRVTEGHRKVSEDKACEEDVAASHHRRAEDRDVSEDVFRASGNEREVDEQVATDVVGSNEVAQGDREVSEDVLKARNGACC